MLKSRKLADLYVYQELFINKLHANDLFANNVNNVTLYIKKVK